MTVAKTNMLSVHEKLREHGWHELGDGRWRKYAWQSEHMVVAKGVRMSRRTTRDVDIGCTLKTYGSPRQRHNDYSGGGSMHDATELAGVD